MSQTITMSSVLSSMQGPPQEEIFNDPEALATKRALMKKMKAGEAYGSISDTTKSIAGPLISVGLALGVPAFVAAGASLAALAAPMVIGGMVLLGAGLIAAAVSATTGYFASHVYHGSNFDQSEFNAKDTARHLVNKLKEHNMQVTIDDAGPSRSDGKRWQDVVRQQTPVTQVS